MDFKATKAMDPCLISVRDLQLQDIPYVLDYWFRSPPGFVESIGVDVTKMASEQEMKSRFMSRLEANQQLQESKLNALAILYANRAIGFHTLVPVTVGDFGIFHAHIWESNMRQKGIGFHSYPMACRVFMDRFDLKKILFKTPVQNIGAIKVKEKLGIRFIGQEVIGLDVIKDGTLGKVFELSRDELNMNWK